MVVQYVVCSSVIGIVVTRIVIGRVGSHSSSGSYSSSSSIYSSSSYDSTHGRTDREDN